MSRTNRPSSSRLVATDRSPKKPIRFKIGVGLLILYPFLYLIIPIAPFLPIDVGFKVGLVAAVLGCAEAVFVLGVACVGKEAYQAIKARPGLGKRKRAKQEAARLAAEAAPSSVPDTLDATPEADPVAAGASSLERNAKDDHV